MRGDLEPPDSRRGNQVAQAAMGTASGRRRRGCRGYGLTATGRTDVIGSLLDPLTPMYMS